MVKNCYKCDIAINRKHIVNGEGSDESGLMFIGEAPGYYEDKEGKPFVGQSGKFLTELINSIGFEREDVYITNVIKCRPPGNRTPSIHEIVNCNIYLKQEILKVKPRIIVLLGVTAVRSYFNRREVVMSRVHGKKITVKDKIVICTYHPSFGIRSKRNADIIRKDFDRIYQIYTENVNVLHERNI